MTATATHYMGSHVEGGRYTTSAYYPGHTYQLQSAGWSSRSGTYITCSAKGLYIPNSSANGFYITVSIPFAI